MALTEAVIDVSEHQGDIDFAVCYAAGIRNAIPRAGIGGRYDFKLQRNVEGFRDVGITVPALYWFINPKSSYTPEQQGELARIACELYQIPTMMLDCEWYTSEGGPNPPIAGFDYNLWCQRFISMLGVVRAIIYTSPAFWNSWGGDGADFGHLDTIIASYKWQNSKAQTDPIAHGVPPDRWGEVVTAKSLPALPIGWDTTIEGWQFSAGFNGQGPVYGMRSGDLDLNVVDPDALARWLGAPSPQPPTTTEDLMYVVLELGDADAVFLAMEDGGGRIFRAEWIDAAMRDAAIWFGSPVRHTASWGDLGYIGLDGPLPAGDSRHDWTGAEFRRLYSVHGEKGDKGDPGPAPTGVTFTY